MGDGMGVYRKRKRQNRCQLPQAASRSIYSPAALRRRNAGGVDVAAVAPFAVNPDIKLLLTVSPIRHLKDGAHGNRLSKAALLLFCDELMQRYPDRCHYFPAYEIVLDELRDYRFYDTDMVHPSAQAIEYVWERFSETFFDKETLALHREWKTLSRASQHRPLTPDKEAYRRFVEQHILRLEEFHKKYPDFSVAEELAAARRIIEKSDSDEIPYK